MATTPQESTDLIELARHQFGDIRRRLVTTLERMSPEDLAWRPNEASNSAANLTLHICGNLRQRFRAGFGGAEDTRDRRGEFADRETHDAAELIRLVHACFDEADRLLAATPAAGLGKLRTIQGTEQTLAFALVQVVGHYAEHLGQIMFAAKARQGDRFERIWPPARRRA